MRKRQRADIVLDFTSLLDVTLILLFFFIMFSSFQTENQKREAEETLKQAEEIASDADEKYKKAEEKEKMSEKTLKEMQAELVQTQEELEQLRLTASDISKSFTAVSDFASSDNLKIICYTDRGLKTWHFDIKRGDELIRTIYKDNYNKNELLDILKGIPDEMFILCEYISDSDTYIEANAQFKEMREAVQENYKHFLVSETKI